jgi:hypothetical protein
VVCGAGIWRRIWTPKAKAGGPWKGRHNERG